MRRTALCLTASAFIYLFWSCSVPSFDGPPQSGGQGGGDDAGPGGGGAGAFAGEGAAGGEGATGALGGEGATGGDGAGGEAAGGASGAGANGGSGAAGSMGGSSSGAGGTGGEGNSGGLAGEGGTGPDTASPTAPQDLTLDAATATTLELLWTPASDNVEVTGYKVYRAASLVGTVAGTRFTFTGLAPDTSYTLGVRALDAANNHSALASLDGKTTKLPDSDPPSLPGSLSLGETTTTSIALDWEPSIDDVGVTGYNLYVEDTLVTTVTGTSYTYVDLLPDTNYTLGVSAYDAAANESLRATIAGATLAEGNCGAPLWIASAIARDEYRTAVCSSFPNAGTQCQGFAGKKRAFRCLDGVWCDSTSPNGTQNDVGIWRADPGDC